MSGRYGEITIFAWSSQREEPLLATACAGYGASHATKGMRENQNATFSAPLRDCSVIVPLTHLLRKASERKFCHDLLMKKLDYIPPHWPLTRSNRVLIRRKPSGVISSGTPPESIRIIPPPASRTKRST